MPRWSALGLRRGPCQSHLGFARGLVPAVQGYPVPRNPCFCRPLAGLIPASGILQPGVEVLPLYVLNRKRAAMLGILWASQPTTGLDGGF